MSAPAAKVCLACGRGPEEVPLLAMEYRGGTFWICPQHLPVLIHKPSQLADRLPGAGQLRPARHDDCGHMTAGAIESVTKTYGPVVAVDDLSLVVPEGTIYGFIGPNGSGKTTTLRMILHIIEADRGTIRVFGETLRSACTARIGYVPEERGLYRKMKVREVLEYLGGLMRAGPLRQEVDAWLERLDLTAWADKKVEALSKGMSQKVQFIAAVVARPPLLVLDEPFTGLDPVNADVLREAILWLRAEGTTVLFSTHDMAVAERMCDTILMIFRGKKVLDGTLAAIQDRYGTDTVRIRSGDGQALAGLAGVERLTDFGQVQELRLDGTRSAQDLVREILGRTTVTSFEVMRPSLRDIFLRIAGPEAREASDA
ncbi:MAG: ATP-binding cassette domain-containing protein [Gemmatimonadetes bacterium]|nr:ATP-binding cassette domain-containing protein [Gemmatimonadota bacterium]